MLPTFKRFYNNVLKNLNESVDIDSLPIFKDPTTIYDHITIENGEKVIKGNVRFEHRQLTELPDLSDVKVLGRFLCYGNKLQTLEGAPKYVGDFDCSRNDFQTLEGAPKYVGRHFGCSESKLQTLEGAPEYVGRHFFCERNPQLTSLKGLPKYIGGDLYWHGTKVTMEDFYENLILSDVKGNPMASYENQDGNEYPVGQLLSNEEAYDNAKAYKLLYNTPSDYTIDF